MLTSRRSESKSIPLNVSSDKFSVIKQLLEKDKISDTKDTDVLKLKEKLNKLSLLHTLLGIPHALNEEKQVEKFYNFFTIFLSFGEHKSIAKHPPKFYYEVREILFENSIKFYHVIFNFKRIKHTKEMINFFNYLVNNFHFSIHRDKLYQVLIKMDLSFLIPSYSRITLVDSLLEVATLFLDGKEENTAIKFYEKAFELADAVQKTEMIQKLITERNVVFYGYIIKKFPYEFYQFELEELILKKERDAKLDLPSFSVNPSDFIKSTSDFLGKDKVNLPNLRRNLFFVNKKPKTKQKNLSRPSIRDKNNWIEIVDGEKEGPQNISINEIIPYCGELSRILQPFILPKYRRDVECTKIYSKEIKNSAVLENFLCMDKKKLMSQNFSRVMSSIFIRYVLLDDDTQGGNMLISKHVFKDVNAIFEFSVAVNIDFERFFSPLSERLFDLFLAKENKRSMVVHEKEEFEFKDGAYVGRIHGEDYKNFPCISHAFPYNWIFNETYSSGDKIYKSQNKDFINFIKEYFQNEKHYMALKILLCRQLMIDLLPVHISNVKNKVAMRKLLDERLSQLKEVCLNDKDFVSYLITHGIFLLHTILFELFIAFEENPHYQVKAEFIQQELTNRFESIFQLILKRKLTEKEQDEIKNYSGWVNSPYKNDKLIAIVSEVYKANNMWFDYYNVKQKVEEYKLSLIQVNAKKNEESVSQKQTHLNEDKAAVRLANKV